MHHTKPKKKYCFWFLFYCRSNLEKQKVTKSPDFNISNIKTTTSPPTSSVRQNGETTTTRSWKKNDEKLTSANDDNSKKEAENSTWFDDLFKVNLTTSVGEVVPKVNSCSPLLTQLFSGKFLQSIVFH